MSGISERGFAFKQGQVLRCGLTDVAGIGLRDPLGTVANEVESKTRYPHGMAYNTQIERPRKLRHKKKSTSLRPGTPPSSTFTRLSLPSEAEKITPPTQFGSGNFASSASRQSHRSTVLNSSDLYSTAIPTFRESSQASSPFGRANSKTFDLERSTTTKSNAYPRFPSLLNLQQRYRPSVESSVTTCKKCGKNKRV